MRDHCLTKPNDNKSHSSGVNLKCTPETPTSKCMIPRCRFGRFQGWDMRWRWITEGSEEMTLSRAAAGRETHLRAVDVCEEWCVTLNQLPSHSQEAVGPLRC